MKRSIIKKIPDGIRRRIIWLWLATYQTKTITRERAMAEVQGLLLGCLYTIQVSDYPGDFVGEDCQTCMDYYQKWFSL